MPPFESYDDVQPTRQEIDAMPGAVLLEFGATWCGFCQALQPQLAAIMNELPNVRHIKIEDGKGKPLGRSFRVKLWPTLVFMRNGEIIQQVSRPNLNELQALFEAAAEKT